MLRGLNWTRLKCSPRPFFKKSNQISDNFSFFYRKKAFSKVPGVNRKLCTLLFYESLWNDWYQLLPNASQQSLYIRIGFYRYVEHYNNDSKGTRCHHRHGTLQWRHNGHDGVSNHQPQDCLLNRLFGHRSKKSSKLRVIGLCAGNSPDRWIPRTNGQ